MPLIISNISKTYNKRKILDNVTLSINDNEFVVVLGPSGCGKTTLLKIIAGLEKEDSGTIQFNDLILNELEPKDRLIGMVFQSYALYPHLSVFDNIAFPLKINRVSSKTIQKKVEEIAEFLGLKEFLHYKPKQLSGGQKQRVALGRAISRNPKIFLFDEPLSNLDAKLRSTMRFELYQLHKTLNTISIYVTHDQVEAMTMGDRIVVLNNGIIQQIGTPREIYERPANTFVASFVGSPQINFLNLTSTEIKEKINANELSESVLKYIENNQNVLIGIRPENLTFLENQDGLINLGNAKIITIEYLGNESIVNIQYKDQILRILWKEYSEVSYKSNVNIFAKKSKILFFDTNGKLIG